MIEKKKYVIIVDLNYLYVQAAAGLMYLRSPCQPTSWKKGDVISVRKNKRKNYRPNRFKRRLLILIFPTDEKPKNGHESNCEK